MAFPLLLLIFIFPISFFPFTSQDAILLDNVCKQTTAYDLCVSALLSDSRSPTADLSSLALVSLNLVFRNITDTRRTIDRLLHNARDPNVKEALGECLFLYGDKKATLYALSAFLSWISKDYNAMSSDAKDVAYFANECELILDRSGIRPSPLGPRNDYVVHLTEITTAIGKMLT